MAVYRIIYTVGHRGDFDGMKNIECSDDQEAIRKAEQTGTEDRHDVELWQVDRFIRRFPHYDPED